jgi:hypothetical protein
MKALDSTPDVRVSAEAFRSPRARQRA